jgi:hypothetical protein
MMEKSATEMWLKAITPADEMQRRFEGFHREWLRESAPFMRLLAKLRAYEPPTPFIIHTDGRVERPPCPRAPGALEVKIHRELERMRDALMRGYGLDPADLREP